MMNAVEIERTFPGGQRLPHPIVDICAFLEKNGYPISGCFELSAPGTSGLKAWFGGEPSILGQFLPFGRGACGDIYALWLTEGLSPDRAPVVMLGSEGELAVLACDPEQFCRLLCLGYSEIGLDDSNATPRDFDEAEPFRRFMLARYGFELPATAAPIIDEAKARFPSFEDWVHQHLP